MGIEIPSWIKKVWNDPVGAGLVVAFIGAVVGGIPTYFLGWWPIVHQWLVLKTVLPNWYLLIVFVIAVLCAPAVILKFFPGTNGDIKKLLKNISDDDYSVVKILRDAKVIAKKIGDKEFIEWADRELKGDFKSLVQEDLPTYRRIYGNLKAFNPYRGWEPVNFHSADDRESFSYAPTGQSIGSIEDVVKSRGDRTIAFIHSPKQKQILMDNIGGCTDVQLILSHTLLQGIVTAVRNRVYEWASHLE